MASTCELPSGYTEQIEEMERFMKQTWEDKERDSQRHEDVVTFFLGGIKTAWWRLDLGPWFQSFILFYPDPWGKWSNLTSIFFKLNGLKPPTCRCFRCAVVVFFAVENSVMKKWQGKEWSGWDERTKEDIIHISTHYNDDSTVMRDILKFRQIKQPPEATNNSSNHIKQNMLFVLNLYGFCSFVWCTRIGQWLLSNWWRSCVPKSGVFTPSYESKNPCTLQWKGLNLYSCFWQRCFGGSSK